MDIFNSSEIVRKGLEEWYSGWEKRDFKNVKNVDIWKPLKALYDESKNIKLRWVRGHDNNKWNEYIDKLIVNARKQTNKSI